jgi:peptide-methionine (S)-S-oxide reductase
VVKVEFDPQIISLGDVLDVFWAIHDPTTLNRQGNDVGREYRSMILYATEEQQHAAETSRNATQKLWPNPIVTEIKPLEHFYPAEENHQDYFAKNPTQGYCQVVINPKLEKLTEKYQSLLK